MNWIPESIRLPDDDTTVMIFTDGEVYMGWHTGDCWLNAEGFPCEVTHWAELPGGPTL